MACAQRWVGTEVVKPPTFYGLNDLEEILLRHRLWKIRYYQHYIFL
jgi:hypothetical protein